MLEASCFGSPAARRRFILLAARQGIPLPEFPTATHFSRVRQPRWRMCDDEELRDSKVVYAAHEGVTPEDALGDLAHPSMPPAQIQGDKSYTTDKGLTNYQRKLRRAGKDRTGMHIFRPLPDSADGLKALRSELLSPPSPSPHAACNSRNIPQNVMTTLMIRTHALPLKISWSIIRCVKMPG
jgi:hypothetical protein